MSYLEGKKFTSILDMGVLTLKVSNGVVLTL